MSKYISKFRQNGKRKMVMGMGKTVWCVVWSAAHGTKNFYAIK